MKDLIIGEKVKIHDFLQRNIFEVEVAIHADMEIDFCCFGLDVDKKLSDDRYMIFYNQKVSPDEAIRILEEGNNRIVFQIDISKLDDKIKNIVFTGTVDGNFTMSKISEGYICLSQNKNAQLKFSFNGNDFKEEKAIIISEIYNKEVWRMSAVAKGFSGGLSALLKHFGGEEIEEETTTTPNNTNLNSSSGNQPVQRQVQEPQSQTQNQPSKPLSLGLNQIVQIPKVQNQPSKPLNLGRNQNVEVLHSQNKPSKPLYLGANQDKLPTP